MENKVEAIVKQFFNPENIESVKVFSTRAIVTLRDIAENAEVNALLEKSLLALPEIEKVSIIYTADKKVQKMNAAANDKYNVRGVKKIIGVASGKGGVGKSTTAVNLALALSKLGLNVAVFDADIYGPSVPTMLGYEGAKPISFDGKTFEAFDYKNVKSMSIGTLIDKSQPLIWRGAKACGAIEQLLTETNWGEIDVMVIDMPPGTGDIQITMSQKLDLDGVVIVSTPQDIALIDAIKGVNMFKRVDVPILGIIENMSYYLCEKCGHRADIFGHEGAKKTAEEMGETFLGEIPLHLSIRQNADAGTPIVLAEPKSPHTKAYLEIAGKIKAELKI